MATNAARVSLNDNSLADDITAGFDALIDNFDRLLLLHAGDSDVVISLERVKALARRGSQLSRKLPD